MSNEHKEILGGAALFLVSTYCVAYGLYVLFGVGACFVFTGLLGMFAGRRIVIKVANGTSFIDRMNNSKDINYV